MTFKDLRSQLSKLQESPEYHQVFVRLRNKPFWIWEQAVHRQEYSGTHGDCCFNHIVGLPRKDKKEFPLFDYEKLLYDSLLIPEFNNPLHPDFKHKHLWVKKATGLGITGFMLRMMAWLCTRDNSCSQSQMWIVTGPNIEMATKLIRRAKDIFSK